jgi:hypothetical protein
VLCFWRSELYARDSRKRGRWGLLEAVNALCFQDPLFLITLHHAKNDFHQNQNKGIERHLFKCLGMVMNT